LPASILKPTHIPGVRDSAPSPSPSLLNAIQPVSLTENMSDDMLIEKVLPQYPGEALRTGQQGKVVLQAWIATDGSIRDLKLVSGPLVLGQAAYEAVRRWRYRPYLLNGHPAEAMTYVTVDFKMPADN
jgi:protein TonB